MSKVAIVVGSDSDLPVVQDALLILDEFHISYEVRVLSAHRAPGAVTEFARSARSQGFSVIIGAAGLAAHLPGVLAAQTTLPVIGLPMQSGPLAGQDALYSIVQMPPGIPVGSVGIGAARNAALFAVEILAVNDEGLAAKLVEFRQKMEEGVLAKDRAVQASGVRAYLQSKK